MPADIWSATIIDLHSTDIWSTTHGRRPGAEFGGTQKLFRGPISGKISIFRVKISDDLFLVIDLVLRIFPFFSHIFRMFTMLNVVYMTISSQEKHNFHSVHAFTHIRQHYFSKYWGDQCMGGPPTSTFGGTVPPSPP